MSRGISHSCGRPSGRFSLLSGSRVRALTSSPVSGPARPVLGLGQNHLVGQGVHGLRKRRPVSRSQLPVSSELSLH